MFKTQLIGATLALAVLAPAERGVRATGSTANIVFEWNQILQDTVPAPQGVLTPRYFAMTHIAMFDAINTIEREFEPYRVRLRPSGGGSPEAAAAQAAHDVLVVINPAATATYDAALARQLGQNPSGFVRRGAALGARVAKAILQWRQNDGWVVSPFPAYSEPPVPGRWQPTPPNHPVATFTHLQKAAPMALLTPTQYLPPPPPSLTSERYAADLNEVKLIGKSDSATRTADQTAIARLWAGIATTRRRHGHQLPVGLEQYRSRRGARAPAVARRGRSRVRARERVGARRSADSSDEQVRLRPLASGHRDPSGRQRPQSRDRSGSDMAAAAHHSAVSHIWRQHGVHRRERRARAPARLRHERHSRDRDVASIGRTA